MWLLPHPFLATGLQVQRISLMFFADPRFPNTYGYHNYVTLRGNRIPVTDPRNHVSKQLSKHELLKPDADEITAN